MNAFDARPPRSLRRSDTRAIQEREAARAEFEARLAQSHLTPDKPLHAVCIALWESARDAKESSRLGFTPEIRAELSRDLVVGCRDEMRRGHALVKRSWLTGAAGVIAAGWLIAGAAGFAAGTRYSGVAVRAESGALLGACTADRVRVEDGRRRCGLWFDLDAAVPVRQR